MKKILSLVLVLVMVLGLSVTAFAEEPINYGVYFGDQEFYVTSENQNDVLGDADGDAATVTFDPETYTFTFNNVNTSSMVFASHIWASEGYQDKSFKIKLIGENTLGAITANDPVEIIGDGSLNLAQLAEGQNVTVGMTGTLNITGNGPCYVLVEGYFTVKEGAGKITIRHTDRRESAYPAAMSQEDYEPNDKVTLPDGYKMVGSTDENVTDEAVMSDNITYNEWGDVLVDGEYARSIVIYSTQSKNSTTTITATKEEPKLAYSIVIPQAVTDLTEENHTDVQLGGEKGEVSIDVTTDNSKTKVYYTVDLENATLTDGENNITTSYTYAQGGEYKDLTENTKVLFYNNKTVKSSTIKVTADNDEWTNAPSGEYSATLMFNFTTVEFGTNCDVDLTAYPRIMQIVKIEDGIVTCDALVYDKGVLVSKLAERTTTSKENMDKKLLEYAVGDCFHVSGKTIVKCTAPASHELDYEKVAFTVDDGFKTKVYAVPTGTTYEVRDGKLYVNCSDEPLINDEDLTWTLNDVTKTNGDTGTITDGDSFKGISYQ